MKLLNIFKKENTKNSKTNIQTIDKKQLEKVIGGGDTTGTTTSTTEPTRSYSPGQAHWGTA